MMRGLSHLSKVWGGREKVGKEGCHYYLGEGNAEKRPKTSTILGEFGGGGGAKLMSDTGRRRRDRQGERGKRRFIIE